MCTGRLKSSSPTITLPCPPSCESSCAVRASSPSVKSDVGDDAADSMVDAAGGTSCCRGLPHVERDRAVSTVARRSVAHLPPPPPPRRSDWTAWNAVPPPSTTTTIGGENGEAKRELTSTV